MCDVQLEKEVEATRQRQAEQAKREQDAAVESMTKKIEETEQEAEQVGPTVIASTVEEGVLANA